MRTTEKIMTALFLALVAIVGLTVLMIHEMINYQECLSVLADLEVPSAEAKELCREW